MIRSRTKYTKPKRKGEKNYSRTSSSRASSFLSCSPTQHRTSPSTTHSQRVAGVGGRQLWKKKKEGKPRESGATARLSLASPFRVESPWTPARPRFRLRASLRGTSPICSASSGIQPRRT
ncbi:unnamed protein product [Urochloa humidicola]